MKNNSKNNNFNKNSRKFKKNSESANFSKSENEFKKINNPVNKRTNFKSHFKDIKSKDKKDRYSSNSRKNVFD